MIPYDDLSYDKLINTPFSVFDKFFFIKNHQENHKFNI